VAQNPIVRALTDRCRRGGSDPLLTWYRPGDGARTELSVRTYANWVDKTANLLETLEVSGLIAAPVSSEHPGHWMSLVWPLAAWQRGCSFTPGFDPAAELVVIGRDDPQPHTPALTVACSLHPLALGLRDLPAGVLDFTGEATGVIAGATAWQEAGRLVTHEATAGVRPVAARVLVRPSSAWETLAAAVLGPLLGGGSAVLVDGPVAEDVLARLVAAERVDASMA